MAPKKTHAPDPTTDGALVALDATYAVTPDIPVDVAVRETASLARLARASQPALARIGVSASMIAHLAAFSKRLAALEAGWKRARARVHLGASAKKELAEAEALDAKLLAGGRWACRKDALAQEDLTRIAEGSGLTDTIQDLRDLVAFWSDHEADRSDTDITSKDLARATELADLLEAAAANEASDVNAAAALDLRNRAFWAGDELAKEIREGGRYAFRKEPKIAAKFLSRYRTAIYRRARRKTKSTGGAATPSVAA